MQSRLTEADLMRFSQENGLPSEYVRLFFDAMAKSGGLATALSGSVSLEVFSRYVRSREEALQRVFNALDKDGDGLVTPAQLKAGLHHITFQCPNSRYTYRTCTDKCARALMSKDFPMCPMQRETPNITFCKFRHFFMLLPHDSMMMEYWVKMGDPACVDVGDRIRFQDSQKASGGEASSWGHLLAGAFAGAVSRTATAPLETVRLMAMTGTLGGGAAKAGGSSVLASVACVVQRQGWRALYRGNGANVVRSAPQKALDFFAFDTFKNCLSGGGSRGPAKHQPSAAHTFVAAGLAGAVSNAVLYPLEVVRCRLTTDTAGAYKGIAHAAATIARMEGPFALYRGLLPSVAAILPEAAITYGLFDLLKRSYANMSGHEPGVAASLAFGVASAFSGQLVAYPLETISRRMQVMTHGNALTAAAEVWNSGGPGALYKGLAAACIRLIPMAMISFGTYEFVRTQITKLEMEWDRMETTRELQRSILSSQALATSI